MGLWLSCPVNKGAWHLDGFGVAPCWRRPRHGSRRFVWVFLARGHFAAKPPLGRVGFLGFPWSVLSGHEPAVYSVSFPCTDDINEAVTAPRPTAWAINRTMALLFVLGPLRAIVRD
jgi:hypothetical protein